MIVCVCRRLNSAKITAAVNSGARTPASVLAHHGERFNCGKCRCAITEMIEAMAVPQEDLAADPIPLAAE